MTDMISRDVTSKWHLPSTDQATQAQLDTLIPRPKGCQSLRSTKQTHSTLPVALDKLLSQQSTVALALSLFDIEQLIKNDDILGQQLNHLLTRDRNIDWTPISVQVCCRVLTSLKQRQTINQAYDCSQIAMRINALANLSMQPLARMWRQQKVGITGADVLIAAQLQGFKRHIDTDGRVCLNVSSRHLLFRQFEGVD